MTEAKVHITPRTHMYGGVVQYDEKMQPVIVDGSGTEFPLPGTLFASLFTSTTVFATSGI